MDKTPKTWADVRLDSGWEDAMSGMGNPLYDRTTRATFGGRPRLTQYVVESLYRTNGIAAKIINVPVDEALRPGLTSDLPPNAATVLVDNCSHIPGRGVLDAIAMAQKSADVYGAAALIAMDGRDPALPPTRGGVRSLALADRYQLHHRTDGMWQIQTLTVHPDRVVMFGGAELTPYLYDRNEGWPDSRYDRIFQELQNEGATTQTAAQLVREAVVGKYVINGLGQLIANQGAAWVKGYMRIQHMMRSVFNAVLLDSDGEGYSTDSVDFTGLTDLLDRWPERVAAVAEIPMMLLYGKSAPGMNATGESDLRGFYDRIDARYRGPRGLFTAALGRIMEWYGVDNYEPSWGPLYTLTELEQAQVLKTEAEAYSIHVAAGVLLSSEVASALYDHDESPIQLDLAARSEGTSAGLDPVTQIQQARLAIDLLTHPTLGPWSRRIIGAPPMTAEEINNAREETANATPIPDDPSGSDDQ